MSLVWLNTIFLAFLQICVIGEVVSHFVILVSVVPSDPMEADISDLALTLEI